MTRVWIGDARCEQLQYWWELQKQQEEEEKQKKAEEEAENASKTEIKPAQDEDIGIKINHSYIINNTATFDWFIDSAVDQMLAASSANAEVIFMLGLYDCINNCRLHHLFGKKTKDLTEDIAASYCDHFNELVEKYKSIRFYFCSINSITENIPDVCSEHSYISADEINTQISIFNEYLKENCEASYIDVDGYLKQTCIKTLDGVLFTKDICLAIQAFIESKLYGWAGTAVGNFIPRTTAPGLAGDEETKFWISNSGKYGGYNSCMVIDHKAGTVIPNCVGYAWGRFMEILGSTPALSTANAENWYGHKDGYERGVEPQLGAVLCWRKGEVDGGHYEEQNGKQVWVSDGAGHVAIVEEIIYKEDGSVDYIKTSESGYVDDGVVYDPATHFSYRTRYPGNWSMGSAYTFQGFIYCPAVTGGIVNDFVSKSDVTTQHKYLNSEEQKKNARYIWQYLGSRGWTLNAVAGMLGNIQSESSMNPNLCEGMKGLAWPPLNPTEEDIGAYFEAYKAKNNYYQTADSGGSRGRYPGYGLTQWTFAYNNDDEARRDWRKHKHIKWCKDRGLDFMDIDSHLEHLIWEKDTGKQFSKSKAYPITFKEFSVSTKPARWLAEAFLDNYENPAVMNFQQRGDRGEYWFNYLLQYSPGWGDTFEVSSFKLDKVGTTTAQASFIVTLGEKGSYRLLDKQGNTIIEEELDVKPEVPKKEDIEEEKDEKTETDEKKATQENEKVVVISLKNLRPNTEYSLELTVSGQPTSVKKEEEDTDNNANDKDEKIKNKDLVEESLTITTLQSFPKPVSKIDLILQTDSEWNLPDSAYSLTVTQPSSWGYWKSTNNILNHYFYGYALNILINSTPIFNEPLLMNTFEQMNFVPESNPLFIGHIPKLGDTMQVSINTWVTDDNGECIMCDKAPVMSNPICMLNKPYRIYLNRKDVNS